LFLADFLSPMHTAATTTRAKKKGRGDAFPRDSKKEGTPSAPSAGPSAVSFILRRFGVPQQFRASIPVKRS
jgi:hypothetical protein